MAKKLNQIEFNILGTIDSFLESNKGVLKSTLDSAEGKPVVFNIASEGGDFFEGLASSLFVFLKVFLFSQFFQDRLFQAGVFDGKPGVACK